MNKPTDTERINWLEINWRDIRKIDLGPKMDGSGIEWSTWTPSEGRTKRLTMRDAIDAAMLDLPSTR
jgi:hypothetical protein